MNIPSSQYESQSCVQEFPLIRSILPWLQIWDFMHVHMLVKYNAVISILVTSTVQSVIYAPYVLVLNVPEVLAIQVLALWSNATFTELS